MTHSQVNIKCCVLYSHTDVYLRHIFPRRAKYASFKCSTKPKPVAPDTRRHKMQCLQYAYIPFFFLCVGTREHLNAKLIRINSVNLKVDFDTRWGVPKQFRNVMHFGCYI